MNSPDKKNQWIKHIIGFVDDKRQYANDWNKSNLTNFLKKGTLYFMCVHFFANLIFIYSYVRFENTLHAD